MLPGRGQMGWEGDEEELGTFLKKCLLLRERERERERELKQGRGRERQRETQNPKQAPSSELSAQSSMQGLNSQTLRSRPESKLDA